MSLKDYQLVGLNWLCLMHKQNLNSILADEMVNICLNFFYKDFAFQAIQTFQTIHQVQHGRF